MKKLLLLVVILTSLVGCSHQGVWRTYSPAISDLIGTSVSMRGNQIVVVEKIPLLSGKPVEVTTYDGSGEEHIISVDDRTAALDIIYKKVTAKLGATSIENVKTTASNTKMDILNDWVWMPISQTFVYAGLRADSATIDFTSTQQITAGTFKYKDIGTIDISVKNLNEYHAVISNSKVYYRIQIAKVVQTFSGTKFSNGWRTRNDPNVAPIVLSEDKKETGGIQPHQWVWKKWFGDEMPWLSLLLLKDGSLCVRRIQGGFDLPLIRLDKFEKNSRWDKRSAYLFTFPVGDLERKIVVLDIEAKRDGSSVVIEHARIRYPEVRLEILN